MSVGGTIQWSEERGVQAASPRLLSSGSKADSKPSNNSWQKRCERRSPPRPNCIAMGLTRSICFALSWSAILGVAGQLSAAEPNAAGIEFFEKKVRPLFAENCYPCHGEEKQKNHLRLDSPAAIRTGGDGGAIITPEHPENSRIILAVGYRDEDLKMPPKKQLSAGQVADLTEGVKLGAPMPAEESAGTIASKKEFQITDRDSAHWAFQPLKKPATPSVKQTRWAANPLDYFILARLEGDGFDPQMPATESELIRRAR